MNTTFQERARIALLEVVAQGSPPPEAVSPARRFPRRTFVVAGVAAAVLVAAGTAATMSDGQPAKPSASTPKLTAAALLTQIAAATDRRPAAEPRDDQWFYSRYRLIGGSAAPGEGGESWFPVKGPQKPPTNHPVHVPEPGTFAAHLLDYQWLKKLPTDPDRLVAVLMAEKAERNVIHVGGETVRRRLQEVLNGPLPPKVQAAVYRAAAKLPGVTVVPDVTDAMGRHGIAISFHDALPVCPPKGAPHPTETPNSDSDQGVSVCYQGPVVDDSSDLWVFDKKTFAFFGFMSQLTRDGKSGKAGKITSDVAMTPWVIVDKYGQRP